MVLGSFAQMLRHCTLRMTSVSSATCCCCWWRWDFFLRSSAARLRSCLRMRSICLRPPRFLRRSPADGCCAVEPDAGPDDDAEDDVDDDRPVRADAGHVSASRSSTAASRLPQLLSSTCRTVSRSVQPERIIASRSTSSTFSSCNHREKHAHFLNS